MIAVSTGGPRIQDVNREYVERRERIVHPNRTTHSMLHVVDGRNRDRNELRQLLETEPRKT